MVQAYYPGVGRKWSPLNRSPRRRRVWRRLPRTLRGVNEVLFSLMSEQDKLAELSKLVSKLRFAVESTDPQIRDDAKGEIELLRRYLPDNYYIPALIQAVLDSSLKGAQLAKLYLDRCYKLSSGEMDGAQDLERLIESLRDTP